MNKKISVVIPTYNEEKDIGSCLESLQKQSLRPTEIIIVDDGSTDQTKEIIKKFKNVRLFEQTHQGPGNARNLGAKNAKGDILIFVDADMTFEVDYLKNLTEPLFKNQEIAGTTHDQEIVLNTSNKWSACWGSIRVNPENAKNIKIFRAIRKKKFLELGGFEQKYGYADDQTLWFKYKLKPEVAKKALCYHKNPESLKSVFKQSAWIGASLENRLLNNPLFARLFPIGLVILSPLLIPLLAIKKLIQLKRIRLTLVMFVFMTARYFGTIKGIIRKTYFNENFR